MSEEIFEKPKAPKKKKLTEKQLAGLAKGRARMAEKRALKKKETETKKRLTKRNAKVEQENAITEKKGRRKKKEVIEQSKEATETFLQKRERGDKSQSKFNKLRMDAMDSISTEKDLNIYNTIMTGVSTEMARNPELLYNYLESHASKLENRGKKKQKKSNLELIVEE